MRSHKHPEYPHGLTGEEANELICLAEHHIASGTDKKRRNIGHKPKKKKQLNIKFQARDVPAPQPNVDRKAVAIGTAAILSFFGFVVCIVYLLCG